METKKIAMAVLIILALGVGGYYLYTQNNNQAGYPFGPEVTPAITVATDKNLDSDNDGLPNELEKVLGTYLTKADTDGDGYNDLAEIKAGHNPLMAGAGDKYTPEEWQALKDKIKATDKEFYENNFAVEKESIINKPDSLSSTVSPTPSQAVASSVGDFSSPEATLKSFITFYEAKDIRKLLDTFNKATIFKFSEESSKNKGQLSYETMFNVGLFDIFYHQTKYSSIESTEKFVVMSPEKREVEGGKLTGLAVNQGGEIADYVISQRPDIYLEKENSEWKINMNISILDMTLRKLFVGEKMREEEITNLKTGWRKSLE